MNIDYIKERSISFVKMQQFAQTWDNDLSQGSIVEFMEIKELNQVIILGYF